MENLFLFAFYTVIFYFVYKLMEMKFIHGEMLPLKDVIRDLIAVFGASILASYGYSFSSKWFGNFMDFITENKIVEIQSPQIFTDTPAF